MIEAAPFLVDDAALGRWTQMYSNEVEQINLQSERGRFGPGPLVMRAF